MGFFEDLGRKVEEFKQTAEETAAEEATYVCESCGERFFNEHEACPACGAEAIVERGPPSSDGDGSDDREPGTDSDAH